jgi:phosphoenolpyruvate carboxykinase (ATP)
LHPLRYAELLREKINEYNVPCYLVNTGWVGASASSGAKRISLPVTRKIIHTILDGSIEQSDFIVDNYFGVQIPTALDGISEDILLPTHAWKNSEDYHKTAKLLVEKFHHNFEHYNIDDPAVQNAGPVLD